MVTEGIEIVDAICVNTPVTDSNGTIVAQFGPVIGCALWDTSGPDGERVPTGLYNIYAAQGAQPAITGTPHATVMIIK